MREGRRTASIAIFALLFTVPGLVALAQERGPEGRIALKTLVEKEISVHKENGEIELKRIPATEMFPGDESIYTIQATNISDAPLSDVAIIYSIWGWYDEGSAVGDGAQITFSVDDGASYDVAGNHRIVLLDGTVRSATGLDYTHIRWKFTDALDPGESWCAGFRRTTVDTRTTLSYSSGGRAVTVRSNPVMHPVEEATVRVLGDAQ